MRPGVCLPCRVRCMQQVTNPHQHAGNAREDDIDRTRKLQRRSITEVYSNGPRCLRHVHIRENSARSADRPTDRSCYRQRCLPVFHVARNGRCCTAGGRVREAEAAKTEIRLMCKLSIDLCEQLLPTISSESYRAAYRSKHVSPSCRACRTRVILHKYRQTQARRESSTSKLPAWTGGTC